MKGENEPAVLFGPDLVVTRETGRLWAGPGFTAPNESVKTQLWVSGLQAVTAAQGQDGRSSDSSRLHGSPSPVREPTRERQAMRGNKTLQSNPFGKIKKQIKAQINTANRNISNDAEIILHRRWTERLRADPSTPLHAKYGGRETTEKRSRDDDLSIRSPADPRGRATGSSLTGGLLNQDSRRLPLCRRTSRLVPH